MNVLKRSTPLINILKQTISHKNNNLIKYSFIYSRHLSSSTKDTKDTKKEQSEITTISTATTKTSVDTYEQAPNYPVKWSKSQGSRKDAMIGPRFEQTDLEAQPKPLAAIQLIEEEPIHYVEGRVAVCHGGGGALGHPQIYINLDQPGAHACGYCGIRFEQKHHH